MKWHNTNLSTISTLGPQYGANARAVEFTGKRPRYIRITDITKNGELDTDSIVEADIENDAEFVLQEGDLLFARSGNTVGKTYRHSNINGPCIFAGYLIRFRPNPDIVDSRFLFYFTKSAVYDSWVTSKRRVAGQPNINGKEYSELRIPLPPISEQHRIVEILDQADALRKKRAEADAKAARILPALFYKMFGDPATNPMGWPVIIGKKMFDKIGYGVGSPPPFSKDGIPFLRAGNIKPSGIKRENLVFFEAKYASSIARSRVSTGDVIIVRRGAYTGDCAVIPEEYDGAYVGYDLICQPNEETNPHWFAAAWNYPTVWQRIENIRKRAAQQGLNKEQIESFSLPRPPRDKQDIFASRVRSLSEYSNKQEKIVWKLETLFQTLLHRAFSGDLTAKWREAHLEELLGEMENQAKVLNSEANN